MVDVDGVVSRKDDPLINPEKPPLEDQGLDEPHHMPDGEAGDTGDTLIGNPGVFPIEVGF
jgi:hypothetical protein